MSKREPVTIKGRSLGITALTAAQLLIGIIHAIFGLLLLVSELAIGSQISIVYDIYTIVYGLLTLVFAVYIWHGKKIGWAGTIAVSIFVIIADTLTVLNLPSIPGIPWLAAPFEISYSLIVVFYLFLPDVRQKFKR